MSGRTMPEVIAFRTTSHLKEEMKILVKEREEYKNIGDFCREVVKISVLKHVLNIPTKG